MNRQLTILNFRLLVFTVFFLVVFVRQDFGNWNERKKKRRSVMPKPWPRARNL